jgi:DNA (cytosine-5)-methyltransferase 1
VNAADFGVPQRRERVFIVGFRNDLGVEWDFPTQTHSLDALLFDQWVSGDYWDRHRIASKKRPQLASGVKQRVERLRGLRLAPTRLPWRTTRDALDGLPDPRRSNGIFTNHKFQPGARPYPGHTGSPLDVPAKTLKAGDHGVPGGENMMITDAGEVRYFTVRESARLQTFPDGYLFHGSWTETMRQLGNAVPVALAHLVAARVAEKLVEAEERRLRFQLATKQQVA